MEGKIVLMLSTIKRMNLGTVCTWFPGVSVDEVIENINSSERLEIQGNMVCLKNVEMSEDKREEVTKAWA